MSEYEIEITKHYLNIFDSKFAEKSWLKGPIYDLPKEFKVLEFKPTPSRKMWVYATVGMSLSCKTDTPIELHIFSNESDFYLVELLTTIAHYHITGTYLDLNHTINFGKSWQGRSESSFGFISLPYLYGPELEDFIFQNKTVKCYWLIPITQNEVEFKKKNGVDALEDRFEEAGFDYLDPNRNSTV